MTDTPLDHEGSRDMRIDPALLDRYLAGEAAAEDHAVLEQWAVTPQRRRFLDARREADLPPAERTVSALERLRGRMGVEDRQAESFSRRSLPQRGGLRRWTLPRREWAIAGILGMCITILGIISGAGLQIHLAPSLSHKYSTRNGQRATVKLADGSTVLLGDASTLVVPADFRKNHRAVSLLGQAYFTVLQSATAPFVVQTLQARTQVLGTTFMVRRYAQDGAVQVLVTSGRVSLEAVPPRGHAQILTANILGALERNGSIVVRHDVDSTRILAWTSGRLVFDNTPVHDAIPEIERHYNVQICLADSALTHLSLTTAFGQESLAQVLDILALAFNAKYTQVGRIVTFTAVPRAVRRAPSHTTFPSEVMYGR